MNKYILLTLATLAATAIAATAGDAKAIYEKQCVKCHGADGKGDTKMGKKLGVKDYTDAKVQAAITDADMAKAIKEGKKDGDKVLMKPAEEVTDEDIKALVTLMRSFKK